MGCVYSSSNRTIFGRSKNDSRFHNSDNNLNGDGVNNNNNNNNNNLTNNNNRIFNVINVDDQGNEINSGNIEITDVDLILHQRGKNSIYWPLRSLRRYGFDAELFSFECGRRCSTGPGIYAFKCTQAEQLFNVLQESIQRCSNAALPPSFFNSISNHITSPQHIPGIISLSSPPVAPEPGPRVSLTQRTTTATQHLYSNDVHEYTNTPFYVNTLKISSTNGVGVAAGNGGGANGVVLPLTVAPPVRLTSGNEFKSGTTDINTNYAKLDDLVRYYVNINTPLSQQQLQQQQLPEQSQQQQTSLQAQESEQKQPNKIEQTFSTESQSLSSQPNSPSHCDNHEPMNYVMLDLETGSCSSPTFVTTAPATPTSKVSEMDDSKFLDSNQCSSSTTLTTSKSIDETPPCTPLTKESTSSSNTVATSGASQSSSLTSSSSSSSPPVTTITAATASTGSTTTTTTTTTMQSCQQYATIDFDKTIALSNSVANHRKLY